MNFAHRIELLSLFSHLSLWGDQSKRVAQDADTQSETEALIAKIEHGYICKETGKLVKLPRHARAYARSLALSGGIE